VRAFNGNPSFARRFVDVLAHRLRQGQALQTLR
jgi:hypothetical protein